MCSTHGMTFIPAQAEGFFNGTVDRTTDLVGSTYYLRDPSRGNQHTVDMKNKQGGSGTVFTDTDNSWGSGLLSNRQTVGVDAQYGAAMTWDYYKNVHQREGIANDKKAPTTACISAVIITTPTGRTPASA